MMEVYVRYCPVCREEYQPHLTRCLDCGGPLDDKREGESPDSQQPELEEPSLPLGDYRTIAEGISASAATLLVEQFIAARIPVKVESVGFNLRLRARVDDVPAALAILEREGIVPRQPETLDPVVATEGGPCPACGTQVAPGTDECPECSLQFAGTAGCESCGGEVAPTDQACPACGQPQRA